MERKGFDIPFIPRIIIISAILIIVFSLGIIFQNWGGINKIAPMVINYLRDNVFGNEFVYFTEKKYFIFKDLIKEKFYIDLKSNVIKEKDEKIILNNNIEKIRNEYLSNGNSISYNDYEILSKIVNNFPGKIEPVFEVSEKGEGEWINYNISPKSLKPLYSKTFIRVDKKRKYAKVFLYKFDLNRLKLEFIPGDADSNNELCDGKMSELQRKNVVFAFSGGFQYQHGRYGMKYQGQVINPPRRDSATLLFKKDGNYEIIIWERGMKDSDNYISWRQNLLPLIIDGKINRRAYTEMWGLTPGNVDPVYTVRTGLGFTSDNDLIFAFGESLSQATLAEGMLKSGVVNAMHLDMNYFNTHLVRFERDLDGEPVTYNENKVLSYYNNMYLKPSSRDFFILTLKNEDNNKYQFGKK